MFVINDLKKGRLVGTYSLFLVSFEYIREKAEVRCSYYSNTFTQCDLDLTDMLI